MHGAGLARRDPQEREVSPLDQNAEPTFSARSRRLHVAFMMCVAIVGLSCQQIRVVQEPHRQTLARMGTRPDTTPAKQPEATPTRKRDALVEFLASRRGMSLNPSEIERLAHTIRAAAERHDLEVSLVLAVIHVESRFDSFAVSRVGAIGLMQILPSTGAELAAREGLDWRGARSLFDPFLNVRLGTAYLKQLTERYGNVPTALAAYNWGPGRIDKRLRRGTPLPQVYPGLVRSAQLEKLGEYSLL